MLNICLTIYETYSSVQEMYSSIFESSITLMPPFRLLLSHKQKAPNLCHLSASTALARGLHHRTGVTLKRSSQSQISVQEMNK